MLSRTLEQTLRQSLSLASVRKHEYATVEHLLLALTEDKDGSAVLHACGVDIAKLRKDVTNYIDNELSNLVSEQPDEAKPTAGFQRVLQRAAIYAESSGRKEVTGAIVLIALFSERESHAVCLLQSQEMTRFDAVNFVSHGIPKTRGFADQRHAGNDETRRGPAPVASRVLEDKQFLFVSHVHEDRPVAIEIVEELERRGVRCWIAPRDVRAGLPFDDEIVAAIEECTAMLLIFSNCCNDSVYIRREITVAGESNKRIIPFRVEESAQPKRGLRIRLSDLHWIDGFAGKKKAIEAVVSTLRLGKTSSQ
jgi:hypothetical protein